MLTLFPYCLFCCCAAKIPLWTVTPGRGFLGVNVSYILLLVHVCGRGWVYLSCCWPGLLPLFIRNSVGSVQKRPLLTKHMVKRFAVRGRKMLKPLQWLWFFLKDIYFTHMNWHSSHSQVYLSRQISSKRFLQALFTLNVRSSLSKVKLKCVESDNSLILKEHIFSKSPPVWICRKCTLFNVSRRYTCFCIVICQQTIVIVR